jgi:hypothetical protein
MSHVQSALSMLGKEMVIEHGDEVKEIAVVEEEKVEEGSTDVEPSSSIEEERDAFYRKLRRDLLKARVGELRKYITDNGLNVTFQNGTPKPDIVDMIINAAMEKEDVLK